MLSTEGRDFCLIRTRRVGDSLRSKLSRDLKETMEKEMFFIWEKNVPGGKKGKCINYSDARGCLLHPKNRKEARVAEAEYERRKVGNEVIGNRIPNCVGI